MTTDHLYYGGIIPDKFFVTWYSDIKKWNDANIYNQMARRLLSYRSVAPETEEYGITLEDISATVVTPKARDTAGNEVNVGGTDKSYKVWRWPTGFKMSESAIKKDPRLQSMLVEACQARISWSEDYTFYNGLAANGIVGMDAAAQANPNGVIAAASNGGAWLTDDGSRDIYQDMLNLRGKIKARYRSDLNSLWVVCNSTSADAFDQKDPMSDNSALVADSVCKLFGRSPNAPRSSWLLINDQVANNYVYLISKRPEVAELVEAQPTMLDDNYPRVPIGNLQVVVYQDMGIAIHDYYGFARLEIS